MRMNDNRLLAVLIAVAFLLLWCAGVGVAFAAPAQEPVPQPSPSVQSQGARVIGVLGWSLTGIGFLCVGAVVAIGSRTRRRRRPVRSHVTTRRPEKVVRKVYQTTPVRRYQRNIERRF